MSNQFIAKTMETGLNIASALWFVFQNGSILLDSSTAKIQIPMSSDSDFHNLAAEQKCYLGLYGNIPCFALQLNTSEDVLLPSSLTFQPVRESHVLLANEDMFLIVIRAMQVLHWDKRTRFCGCCGEKTSYHNIEHAKNCARCDTLFYCQISPVMLALVARKNEILLARAPHFAPGVYSILAGFVEPGETLEQCVSREVKEEVNIEITNIRYFASQPWPFPSNLMLGFFADYDSGEIRIDTKELEDAQWYPLNKLPPLPSPASLSRRMIDVWLRDRV